MSAFLPSDIGRLVYGYLQTECNEAIADEFLREAPFMKECREQKQRGRRFYTKIQGHSLTDYLDKFCELSEMVCENAASTDPKSLLNLPAQLQNFLPRKLSFSNSNRDCIINRIKKSIATTTVTRVPRYSLNSSFVDRHISVAGRVLNKSNLSSDSPSILKSTVTTPVTPNIQPNTAAASYSNSRDSTSNTLNSSPIALNNSPIGTNQSGIESVAASSHSVETQNVYDSFTPSLAAPNLTSMDIDDDYPNMCNQHNVNITSSGVNLSEINTPARTSITTRENVKDATLETPPKLTTTEEQVKVTPTPPLVNGIPFSRQKTILNDGGYDNASSSLSTSLVVTEKRSPRQQQTSCRLSPRTLPTDEQHRTPSPKKRKQVTPMKSPSSKYAFEFAVDDNTTSSGGNNLDDGVSTPVRIETTTEADCTTANDQLNTPRTKKTTSFRYSNDDATAQKLHSLFDTESSHHDDQSPTKDDNAGENSVKTDGTSADTVRHNDNRSFKTSAPNTKESPSKHQTTNHHKQTSSPAIIKQTSFLGSFPSNRAHSSQAKDTINSPRSTMTHNYNAATSPLRSQLQFKSTLSPLSNKQHHRTHQMATTTTTTKVPLPLPAQSTTVAEDVGASAVVTAAVAGEKTIIRTFSTTPIKTPSKSTPVKRRSDDSVSLGDPLVFGIATINSPSKVSAAGNTNDGGGANTALYETKVKTIPWDHNLRERAKMEACGGGGGDAANSKSTAERKRKATTEIRESSSKRKIGMVTEPRASDTPVAKKKAESAAAAGKNIVDDSSSTARTIPPRPIIVCKKERKRKAAEERAKLKLAQQQAEGPTKTHVNSSKATSNGESMSMSSPKSKKCRSSNKAVAKVDAPLNKRSPGDEENRVKNSAVKGTLTSTTFSTSEVDDDHSSNTDTIATNEQTPPVGKKVSTSSTDTFVGNSPSLDRRDATSKEKVSKRLSDGSAVDIAEQNHSVAGTTSSKQPNKKESLKSNKSMVNAVKSPAATEVSADRNSSSSLSTSTKSSMVKSTVVINSNEKANTVSTTTIRTTTMNGKSSIDKSTINSASTGERGAPAQSMTAAVAKSSIDARIAQNDCDTTSNEDDDYSDLQIELNFSSHLVFYSNIEV